MRETLRSLSGYGGVLFDLDGTLYRGDTALPGAATSSARAATRG